MDLLQPAEWTQLQETLQWPMLIAMAAQMLHVKYMIDIVMARHKHKIYAPAVSGHPDFDRIFRVQANFVEQYPGFIVGMFLFALFINGRAAAIVGAVWVVFRYLHSERYRLKRFGLDVLRFTVPQYLVLAIFYFGTAWRIVAHLLANK